MNGQPQSEAAQAGVEAATEANGATQKATMAVSKTRTSVEMLWFAPGDHYQKSTVQYIKDRLRYGQWRESLEGLRRCTHLGQ